MKRLIGIICILGLHIKVRDHFIFRGVNYFEKALFRQCMNCGKVINNPNWIER